MSSPSLPATLKRYGKIARLLLQNAVPSKLEFLSASESEENAKELADALEELGPTFVKLGQLLSTRPDLLPEAYIEALTRLQDDLEPFPFEDVEEIVQSELGAGLSKLFTDFESAPVAAASLGQVHRARLRDGRRVVVKVQRPEARETTERDLEALSKIAQWLEEHTDAGQRFGVAQVVRELERTLLLELDYTVEASNLSTMARQLEDFGRLRVPTPIEDYTTSIVLTMDYVSGTKIDDLHPVVFVDLDGYNLADQLFEAYLRQIFVHGFFHADPHPGNVLLTHEGHLALIDLGMVGHLAPRLRDRLLQLLLYVAEGRSEETAELCLQLAERLDDFDEPAFRRDVAHLVSQKSTATVEELTLGSTVLEVTEIAHERGLRIPAELALITKTLLNLDGIGRALAPSFSPADAVSRHAPELLSDSMRRDFSLNQLYSVVLDAKEFIEATPQQLGRILELIAENRLKVEVDAIDETVLIVALQKIANRVAAGLLLAAIIIGAALMMHIETSFTVFGYPGIAMIFFLIAVAGASKLLWDIFWKDREEK